jgi:hypothetical protein
MPAALAMLAIGRAALRPPGRHFDHFQLGGASAALGRRRWESTTEVLTRSRMPHPPP